MTTFSDKEVCEVIADAIKLIEEKGWIRNGFYRPDKGFCMLGAIEQASGFYNWEESIISGRVKYGDADKSDLSNLAASRVVEASKIGKSITWINDAVLQSKKEAIATLRKACE